MDKLLLDALNNLSLSLENLTIALIQKSETKSDVAGALSSGDISKKLDQILSILKSNPSKPDPNLSTPAIVPVTKSIISPTPGTFVKKPEAPVIKPPVSGIQEPRESGPSFKEFSRKYLNKDEKREDDVKSKSKEIIREQTSISSPEEKKPLSIKDRISNIFSRKKEEPVKAEDVNKPLSFPKTDIPSLKGPLSVILIGPKSIIDWFDSQQKKTDITRPLKSSKSTGDSTIVPVSKPASVENKPVSIIDRVKNFFSGRKSEPVNPSEMTGPSTIPVIKGPLSVILVGPRAVLEWFEKQRKTVDVVSPLKPIPGRSESGIIPPRITPPPIIPATPLTPVPSRPAAGIVPPRITPPPIIPATPLIPVPSRPAAGIVPPRVTPPPIIPATPLTPLPSRPASGIVPPRITPPPIIPTTPLTPVPSRPASGIVSPRVPSVPIVSMTPSPLRPQTVSGQEGQSKSEPRIVTNIVPQRTPVVTKPISGPVRPMSPVSVVSPEPVKVERPQVPVRPTGPPTAVPGNPFMMGAPYNSLPVIPVAVVSFADNSTLLASSGQSRVLGKKPMPKDSTPRDRESRRDTTTSSAMSRPSTEEVSRTTREERSGLSRRDRPSQSMSRPSTETSSKEVKADRGDKGGPFDSKKKSIADGVKLLLLMAVGIVAIGLAFKVVGGVDFKSVLALAIALPLVAIAFEKISRVKVTPKEMAMTSLALVVMAGAILLSSVLLSKVRPIGLAQAFATVVIAGVFALIGHKLPRIFESVAGVGVKNAIVGGLLLPVVLVAFSYSIMKSSEFIRKVKPIGIAQAFAMIVIGGTFAFIAKRIPPLFEAIGRISFINALKASTLMPIVLIGLSFAIMASSYLLSKVKPIGIAQAFSTILIAATFAVISLSLGRLLRSFNGLNPVSALIGAMLMPIVLVGVSYAIMKSSEHLRKVKPIGLAQAFSSIVIAATFAVISFGLGKLLKAFDKVNIVEAGAFALLAPIILIATSYAMMKSSVYISRIVPVGLLNFISAMMISLVFVVLSFGLKKMFNAFKDVGVATVLKAAVFLPPILIALSWAIMKSSPFIRNTRPVGILNFLSAIMISIIFVAMSFAAKFIVQNTKNITAKQMVKGGLIVVAMAAAVFAASHFIKLLPVISTSQFASFLAVLASVVGMALVGLALTKIANKIQIKDLIKGSVVVVTVALTIMLTSQILALGKYSNLPGYKWILDSALLITVFGGAVFVAAKLNSRVGFTGMIKGGVTVIMIAATVMLASQLLSRGKYANLPTYKWILDSVLVLAEFGVAIFVAAQLNKRVGFVDMMKGAATVLVVATTAMLTSHILSKGKYTKVPDQQWIKKSAFVILEFGLAVFAGAKLVKSLGITNLLKGALVVLVIAAVVMASSLILSLGKYEKYPTVDWVAGVGLSMVVFATSAAILGSLVAGPQGLVLLAGLGAVLVLAASIIATSMILAQGNYGVYPPNDWIAGVGKTLLLFGTAVVTLGAIASGGALLQGITFGLVQNPLEAGIDAVKKVSELVVETSTILAGGNYSTYPSTDWIAGVAKTLLLFGTAVVTLGAISSGGGALEGLTAGLVKNPIAAGVEAILGISKAIVDSDSILAKGKYTGGPTVEWAKGIGMALGNFSEVYKMILGSQILSLFTGGKVGGGMDTFTTAITSISTAIKTAGDILASGTFTGGPKEEWAKSVGIAIGAFSEVYDMIERAQVLSFFSRGNIGVSVDAFSAAITTLSTGIANAANTLGGVKFEGGPKEEWAKGVALAIGAFSEVYDMLQDQKIMDLGGKIVGKIGKLFGGSGNAVQLGVGVSEFEKAIDTISGGLKKAAENLNSSDGKLWTGGPGETWAKGVGNAIGAFAPVFSAVSESVGMFPGPSIEQFKNAIVTISNGIIEAAGVFNGAGETTIFDLAKAPKAEWGENVGKAITAFTPVFQYLSENTGWFTSGAEAASDLQYAIKSVAEAIKQSSIELAGGDYTTKIEDTWVKTINTLMTDYIKLFETVDTDQQDMTDKSMSLGMIASSIKNTSTTLSLGKYDTVFGDKWDKTVNGLFNDYIKLLDKVDTDQSEMKSKTSAIGSVASVIKNTSITLSLGKYDKVFGKFGNEVSKLMTSFIEILKKIDKSKLDFSKKSGIINLSNTIKQVSDILEKVSTTKAFDSKYPKVVSDLFESYLKIFKRVKDAKLDFKNVEIINQVARSFVRISLELSKGKFTVTIPDNYFKGISKNVDSMIQIIKKLRNFKVVDLLNLNVMVDQVKTSANKIAKIKFTTIPDVWSANFKKTILNFGNMIAEIDKKFSISRIKLGALKIESILGNLVKSSLSISSGKYTNIPSARWISILREIVMRIGQLSIDADKKFGMIGLKSGLQKLKSISETVRDVSIALSRGSYGKFPTISWAKGAATSLQEFLNLKIPSSSLIDKLFGKEQSLDKKKIAGVLDLIMMVDKTFSRGKFKNFPTVSWGDGVVRSLSKFSTIMAAFDFSKVENKFGQSTSLSKMVSNIELLARVFDKLSNSLTRFTSSIGSIDTGKLQAIRTLTSNVVLMSLLDPSQFDRMMEKLEENSAIFGTLLSDSERGGKKTGSKGPGGLAASGGGGGGGESSKLSTVKAVSTFTKPDTSMADQLKLMKQMVEIMADIGNVVGSKGKLGEYLEEKAGSSGKFDWTSYGSDVNIN